MILYFSIILSLYLVLVVIFIIAWSSIPVFEIPSAHRPATFISVIIPARNEAANISQLINRLIVQSYPEDLFEVILVDDGSEDDTVNRAEESFCLAPFGHQIIRVGGDDNRQAPKKHAIQKGIAMAKGELIVTIDADCLPQKGWLRHIEAYAVVNDLQMVTGGVCFTDEDDLFGKMQQLEFLTLIGSGAACLMLGYPNMCNGANLAYRKDAYLKANGFDGNMHIASGDDEFLMHKIHYGRLGKVAFLKNEQAFVETAPRKSLRSFYAQRRRWAGKWAYYQVNNIKILAFFMFLVNFSLIVCAGITIAGYYPVELFLAQFASKVLVEFVFIRRIMKDFKRGLSIWAFIILTIVYPFYVSFFAFISRSGNYLWKGRTFK